MKVSGRRETEDRERNKGTNQCKRDSLREPIGCNQINETEDDPKEELAEAAITPRNREDKAGAANPNKLSNEPPLLPLSLPDEAGASVATAPEAVGEETAGGFA